jgi:hypothetical protein
MKKAAHQGGLVATPPSHDQRQGVLSHPCDKMGAMTDEPDFRADKSDTVERAGNASGRWYAYHARLDEDVVAEAFPMRALHAEQYPGFVRDDIAADAMEQSELIGFWVAWHMAGGFAALEEGGWHRATIFRKVRRFRARYGAHPDEYSFPWIRIDLEGAWAAGIERRIADRRPGFFH